MGSTPSYAQSLIGTGARLGKLGLLAWFVLESFMHKNIVASDIRCMSCSTSACICVDTTVLEDVYQ